MKILHIICSYNSKNLTERLYKELLPQTKDLIVLENSSTPELMFESPHTKDLGRKNIGFGGMHDYIWANEEYKKYDYVAIWNNDVYGIPADFCNRLPNYLHNGIGMAVPALNPEGTGWFHMRKKGNWIRETQHGEDAVGIFNTKLFPIFEMYSPMDFFGILDVTLSMLSKEEGYTNIIIDALPVTHMLSGARKEAGVNDTYTRESASSLHRWHNQFPHIGELYTKYISRYDGVSVIIPNYNHNHLLRRAVESVIRQPIKTEAVVVDDCSPNQDYSCLDGLPVTFVKHEVNKGLASARNTGIKASKMEWILPLDADDELKPGMLKTLFDNKNKGDIIYGDCQYFNGGILTSRPEIEPDRFLRDNQLCGGSLYHKDVWRNVNGYCEDHHTYYEDWAFWSKAAFRGYHFHYIGQSIYNYLGGPDGMCAELGKKRAYNVELVTNLAREYKEWLEKQN